jgi:hypothetical protein
MTVHSEGVRKHRAKMKANGCQRIEVTLGGGMIHRARKVARLRGWPLWQIVEEAIDAYVITDDATSGEASPTGNLRE